MTQPRVRERFNMRAAWFRRSRSKRSAGCESARSLLEKTRAKTIRDGLQIKQRQEIGSAEVAINRRWTADTCREIKVGTE